jgi:hypothetical protein
VDGTVRSTHMAGRFWFRIVAQIVVVAACTTVSAVIVSAGGIRTPTNAIWMFGIPILAAVGFNRSIRMRICMSVINLVVALFSPELLAHSLGYCLY